MYTYKPFIREDSTGLSWSVVLFLDGEEVGRGYASCSGTQAEQEAAIEAEAQRLIVINDEELLKQAELEIKKQQSAAVVAAISAKFDQVKPVPAKALEEKIKAAEVASK